ncbi:MAG: hypothetical protein QM594_16465 [Niabella sp.]
MKTEKFKYSKSHKIIHWGCSFDSLTEMKFAISVMDDYEILRGRVSIYYHPGTLQPTDYIRMCHRRYTPDFLIRHKQTGKAFLIEIKPRGFEQEPQLAVLREIAENYIRWKKYDWQYQVIFDDEIILTEQQWYEFKDCCRLKTLTARKIWFDELNRKYDRSAPSLFTSAPKNDRIAFVMFGTWPAKKVGK